MNNEFQKIEEKSKEMANEVLRMTNDKVVASIVEHNFALGAKWALTEVLKQIAYCTVQQYKFPILHIESYIHKQLHPEENFD